MVEGSLSIGKKTLHVINGFPFIVAFSIATKISFEIRTWFLVIAAIIMEMIKADRFNLLVQKGTVSVS